MILVLGSTVTVTRAMAYSFVMVALGPMRLITLAWEMPNICLSVKLYLPTSFLVVSSLQMLLPCMALGTSGTA